MNAHRLNSVVTCFFGQGAISLLPAELKKRSLKRALIITDNFLFESGIATKVGDELLNADSEYAIYYQVEPNPSIDVVNECANAAKKLEVDYLVAVGGGSAIDTAKAVGILITNGGNIEDYEGVNKSQNLALPIVVVNTTAGTGSEVTNFYIVTNPRTHSKMVMIDDNCMASFAINDIDFMKSMPPKLTASTGMDAMTHAIEAVLSNSANPLSDKDAIWAINAIKDYLPRAVKNGEDIEARNMMSYAEYSAGMAFSNSGLGIVHAMAHSLGGLYDLPHGICNSILLPYAMEFNGQHSNVQPRYKLIVGALEINCSKNMNSKQVVEASVTFIKNLCREVGIPKSFKEFNVKEEDFARLADLALVDSCMPSNPVQPTKQDVINIYKKANM